MNRKKLIEVALPLEAINKASEQEKNIKVGKPTSVHLWWARRPLAAARAVIFAQMVDDPSAYIEVLREDPTLRRKAETTLKGRLKLWEEARALSEKAKGSGLQVAEPGPAPTLDDTIADHERQRLFRIIEDLVLWDNITNKTVLQAARDEIWASWRRACLENAGHPRARQLFDRQTLPAFHDPFAGGGALPLEAQRLGLESFASDLNPVAVLINRAMIEIPPKFADRPAVNPDAQEDSRLVGKTWTGSQGLADDLRYYGQWMGNEAEKKLHHLYPKVVVTAETARTRPDLKPYEGRSLTVVAWLWARTVKSPNPAFAQVDVPLASTFMLSTKAGREAYVEPVIENGGYRFTVKVGKPKDAEAAKKGTKVARGGNFRCLMSEAPISGEYLKAEGRAGRIGTKMMAVVAEGDRGRVYLPPSPEQEAAARCSRPDGYPDGSLPSDDTANFWCTLYGLREWADLFTPRQLTAVTTFSNLVRLAHEQVERDARVAGLSENPSPIGGNDIGATAYADAVATYLALAVSRSADWTNSITRWLPHLDKAQQMFSRQAIPMGWDYVEINALTPVGGGFAASVNNILHAFPRLPVNVLSVQPGHAVQADACESIVQDNRIYSTDPPYYDNIGYADLSDFFYAWLRHSLKGVLPGLFTTLAVPKAAELVATPYRHGSKDKAEKFFLSGMTRAMNRIAEQGHPAFPATVYYAFKQSESDGEAGTTNTGWDTFLVAVIEAGFAVTGTWPIRTEKTSRTIGVGTNALASSIVLVCRPRAESAPTATRREFVTALKAELPQALTQLQRGNIAPVDLAQAAIGPGMAVYTRYAQVIDAEGKPLSVREALSLINQTLDESLSEQEGDFDADSRWALAWFEQSGFAEGEFGAADVLARAKVTSVDGLAHSGIIKAGRGHVRLLRPKEFPDDWDPAADARLSEWEIVHHLIRVLDSGGEGAAAKLVTKLGARAEVARELCYRLYTLCERNKRATEALMYNGLVQSWPEILRLAKDGQTAEPIQGRLSDS